jgi:hypothetical protein
MKYLIGNLVINSAQIIMAKYTPERSGTDDETGKWYSLKSKCEITLTSVYVEERCDFNGNVTGCASASDTVTLYDTDADRFWEAYSSDAYQVVAQK